MEECHSTLQSRVQHNRGCCIVVIHDSTSIPITVDHYDLLELIVAQLSCCHSESCGLVIVYNQPANTVQDPCDDDHHYWASNANKAESRTLLLFRWQKIAS